VDYWGHGEKIETVRHTADTVVNGRSIVKRLENHSVNSRAILV
jgi:hypothetical protein